MFTQHYQMTQLEEFVEDMYARIGITSPDQITVEQISHRLNIWVHYADVSSRALESVAGMHSMFLNNQLPIRQQRLEFFHELCHLLRHAGNQTIMPELFTQAQEREAEHFVQYAAMPFSMFSTLTIPEDHFEAVSYLADIFQVPHNLAELRLYQIQRRILRELVLATADKPTHEYNWSSETQRILEQLDRQLGEKGLPGYVDKGLLRKES